MPSEPSRPAETPTTGRSRRIGEWVLRPGLRTLEHPEHGTRAVRPKLLAILVALAEHPGEVVDRDVLVARTWGTTVVNEEALTRAISELRTLLADDPARPRYVVTLRGAGYRLVAPVEVLPSEEGAPGEPRAGSPIGRPGRVALAAAACLLALGGAWRAGLLGSPTREARLRPLEPRALTSQPGRETDPALSPDGTRVAYAWGGADDANYDLYVQPVDGGAPLRLTEDPARDVHPAWSPDGERLAWIRIDGDGASLWIGSATGGAHHRVRHLGGWASGLDWSPDGTAVVVAATRGGGLGVQRVVLADGRIEPVGVPPEGCRDHSPVFSPSGGRIAFVRSRSGEPAEDRLCIAGAEGVGGGEVEELPVEPGRVLGIEWAHDEERLVLARRVDDTSRLYRVELATGALEEILLREEDATFPTLSDDARTLVYEDARAREKIWRITAAGSTGGAGSWRMEPLLESTRNEREAHLAPDGSRLAFLSDRSGRDELWLAGPGGEDPELLATPGEGGLARPRWSPDGRRLAFQRSRAGRTTLWVVQAAGTLAFERVDVEPGPVAPDRLELVGWTADGEGLLVTSDRGGDWALWRLDARGLAPPRLVQPGAIVDARESPDGRWLTWTELGRSGLWRRPTTPTDPSGADGAPERLAAALQPNHLTQWSLDGARVIYTLPTAAGLTVQRLDLATGRVEELVTAHRLRARSVSVCPLTGDVLLSAVLEGEADLRLASLAASP